MNFRAEVILLILANVLLCNDIFMVEGKLKEGECEGKVEFVFTYNLLASLLCPGLLVHNFMNSVVLL